MWTVCVSRVVSSLHFLYMVYSANGFSQKQHADKRMKDFVQCHFSFGVETLPLGCCCAFRFFSFHFSETRRNLTTSAMTWNSTARFFHLSSLVLLEWRGEKFRFLHSVQVFSVFLTTHRSGEHRRLFYERRVKCSWDDFKTSTLVRQEVDRILLLSLDANRLPRLSRVSLRFWRYWARRVEKNAGNCATSLLRESNKRTWNVNHKKHMFWLYKHFKVVGIGSWFSIDRLRRRLFDETFFLLFQLKIQSRIIAFGGKLIFRD